jgi:hypothetical protein
VIDELIKEMIEKSVIDENELIGCSEDEIKNIEVKYNVKLPNSYKDFLKKMGKNSSKLVDRNEYAIEYDFVVKMTEERRQETNKYKLERELELKTLPDSKRLIAEAEDILELPQNALLILCRLPSYDFYLIEANGGDDSQVFYYDGEEITKEFDSFWDVLRMFIKGMQIDS